MKTEAMPTRTEFKFNCPTCGQHILVATHCIGLGMSCPSCQSSITIPAPASEEQRPPPATVPKHSRQTIRIELPTKADEHTPGLNDQATSLKLESVGVPPPLAGTEPWPDLVRKLEQGALLEPAALATALFHELTEMRQRLDRLEKRLGQEK